MTNQETLQKVLRWNRFPITYNWKDVVVKFDVLLTTKILSLNFISEDRDYRHKLIVKLHQEGYSDKQISKYLNDKGILSPRGRDYYPKLIWVTRKKLKDREIRKDNFEYEISNINFYLMR